MLDVGLGLYAGEFRHSRDAKGRVTVPSKWRYEGDEKLQFLAFSNPTGCITVYPPTKVAELREKVSAIKVSNPVGLKAVMQLIRGADTFLLDTNGRVKISDNLFEKAGIEREVTCVGVLDHFQFWEPERYNQYLSAEELEGGNFLEVLGSLGL